jgi:predicted RNA-binding protein with TRAM domain
LSYGNKGYQRGGFDGERSFGGPKPVEIGKEYDVQVTELSRQGDGIARIQGFVIFVKKSKVGEKTRIKVVNVGQRFATAEKVERGIQPTPEEGATQVSPSLTEDQTSEEKS